MAGATQARKCDQGGKAAVDGGGIPALLLGPADPGSRIHGEDESLHLGDWRSLIRAEVHLLHELANSGSFAEGHR